MERRHRDIKHPHPHAPRDSAVRDRCSRGRRRHRSLEAETGHLLPLFTCQHRLCRTGGFTCLQLAASGPISPEATDEQLAEVKRSLVARGLTLVALNGGGNHLDPAAQQRFVKIIELAGRLGVSFIGGSSGAIAGRSLDEQVQAIVKAYETQYFPSCEKYKVRILWEPYVNPANIATSPVAFAALLRAFKDSPYVGLQMDPSHLAWQMIDPVEATREFARYIFNVPSQGHRNPLASGAPRWHSAARQFQVVALPAAGLGRDRLEGLFHRPS
jgi:hypothetical protein